MPDDRNRAGRPRPAGPRAANPTEAGRSPQRRPTSGRPGGGNGNGPRKPGTPGTGRKAPTAQARPKGRASNLLIIAAILAVGFGVFELVSHFSSIQHGLTAMANPTTTVAAQTKSPTQAPTAQPTELARPTETPTAKPEPTPTTPATQEITISAVGDIMVHEPEMTAAYDKSSGEYDFHPFFSAIKEEISKADFAFGNLETTLSGKDKKYSGYPAFNSPESIVPALKDAGFDLLTTANNHIFDRGYAGVESTIKFLNDQGMPNTGTYLSAEDYNKPFITDVKGLKVAILAYSYGENRTAGISKDQLRYVIKNINLNTVKKDIQKSRDQGADVVIVTLHWGTEYSRAPSATMKSQAEKMFQYGADVVVGSHPHVLQPIERIKVTRDDGTQYEGVVAYSMGNFISNQDPKYRDAGMIFNVTVEKDNATGAVRIKNATYLPTCTYKIDGKTYQVLPVGKYIDDPDLMKTVATANQARVKAVWKETTDLIGSDAAEPIRN